MVLLLHELQGILHNETDAGMVKDGLMQMRPADIYHLAIEIDDGNFRKGWVEMHGCCSDIAIAPANDQQAAITGGQPMEHGPVIQLMIALGALNGPIEKKASAEYSGIADYNFLKGRPGLVQESLYGNADRRGIYSGCLKIIDTSACIITKPPISPFYPLEINPLVRQIGDDRVNRLLRFPVSAATEDIAGDIAVLGPGMYGDMGSGEEQVTGDPFRGVTGKIAG